MTRRRRSYDPGPWFVIPVLLTIVIIALPFAFGWR